MTEGRRRATSPPRSLRAASARGFAVSGGQFAFNRLLSLVGFAVFARLLSTSDYGLATLSYTFLMLFNTLAAGGFGPALAQRASVDQAYRDTTFWMAASIGTTLTAVMCAVSRPLADLFNQPRLALLLVVLSVNFILIGITSVPNALLQRDLRFGAIAANNVRANIVATLVGIALAFAHFGVWALIVQAVVAPVLICAGVWRASRYRPAQGPERALVIPVLDASRHFLGNTLMEFTSQNTDNFLVGAKLGAGPLGVYSVAYRMVYVLMDVLVNSVKVVALPAFAKLQDDRSRLRTAYVSALRVAATVFMPSMLFIAAAAPQVVVGVFGPRWAGCVPITRVLCVYGALQAVMIVNRTFLQAAGAARTAFRLSALTTVIQVVAFFVTVSFGLVWVAASYVLGSYLVAPFGLAAAARRVGIPLRRSLVVMVRPLACAVLMAGVVFVVGAHAPFTPRLAQLALMLPVGVLVYLALLAVVARPHLRELTHLVRAAHR